MTGSCLLNDVAKMSRSAINSAIKMHLDDDGRDYIDRALLHLPLLPGET